MSDLFTAENSAMLLIDHQLGTMKLIENIPLEVVRRNTLALAKTAKILGIPVVLTSSQEQNVQGPLLPELAEILPEAFAARVQRAGIVNAWSDSNFKAAVEETGRRNLIMAGVTTDVCLVYPAITARQEGYQVQAVMDASGSPYESPRRWPAGGWSGKVSSLPPPTRSWLSWLRIGAAPKAGSCSTFSFRRSCQVSPNPRPEVDCQAF